MIQIPVTFDKAARRKSKEVGLGFTTNFEISTEDFSQMDRLLQSEGWLLFSPNEVQEADIPEEPAKSPDRKSKSSRLRAVAFLIWRQSGTDELFEPYYDRLFERVLDKLKERLDDDQTTR